MLGLGENPNEAEQVMRDLRAHSCGYPHARPISAAIPSHLPIIRYVPQIEFDRIETARL